MTKVWHIEGYDSTTKIFKTDVGCNLITDSKLKELLRCLAAKHGLTDQEIVDSYRKKKTRLRLSHLEVTSDVDGSLMCGCNPYFIASVRDA